MCKLITDPYAGDIQLLQQIQGALNVYLNYTGDLECVDLNEPSNLDAAAWGVQYCTELFLPICQRGGSYDFFEPLPLNLTEFSIGCEKDFHVTPEFDKVSRQFGIGKKQLSTASRIIFSNGERDPWSTGGILKLPGQRPFKHNKYFAVDYNEYPQLNGNMHVALNHIYLINIPNACHHEDLRESDPDDPKSMQGARLYELKLITSWIHQSYLENNKFPVEWYLTFESIMNM
jgi:lysosomal Pro-X carboxypeptidase